MFDFLRDLAVVIIVAAFTLYYNEQVHTRILEMGYVSVSAQYSIRALVNLMGPGIHHENCSCGAMRAATHMFFLFLHERLT